MRVAILFTSSHGTTEKVAHEIESRMKDVMVDIYNLGKINFHKIVLSDYQIIILGGSIHAGQLKSTMRKFLKNKSQELLNMKFAIFMCCMNEADAQNQFNNQFPEILRTNSISNKIVGGEYVFEKMNFIEKILVKKIAGVSESLSKINYPIIDEFVSEIKSKM